MRFVVLLLCCLVAMGTVDDSAGQVPEQHPNRHLLPNDNACGATIVDRIVGGNTAELGEYPWMALLGYNVAGTGTIQLRCGGSLINNRYVLTAALCVVATPDSGPPDAVRLGEYDPRTEEDCVIRNGALVCAEPVQDFGIEQLIVHPSYSGPMFFRNDIALVRLDRPATFSEYVSPVCMPFGDWRTRNYVGSEFWIAGFGHVETNMEGDILQELKVPVLLNKMCTNDTYPDLVGSNQLCAGGRVGQDSCIGDSGGPLMGVDHFGTQYRAIGIISFSVREECGIENAPTVYTRVGNYLNWIMNNLQA